MPEVGVRARYRKKTIGQNKVGRTGVQLWLICNLINKGHDDKFLRTMFPKLTKTDISFVKFTYQRKKAEIDREIRYKTGGV